MIKTAVRQAYIRYSIVFAAMMAVMRTFLSVKMQEMRISVYLCAGMRKFACIIAILMPVMVTVYGKNKPEIAPSYSWKVLEPLGLREPSDIDTLKHNYAQRSVPSEVSDAWACTGNLGAEGIDMIFIDRQGMSDFFFRDALATWIPTTSKMRFYNTRIPMTLLSYNMGGGRENAQERLRGEFSGNINSRAQVGALLDYLYSKGSYDAQATKDLIWGFSGSYMGDRYEFQGAYNHYNLLNKESGGITDDLYITDPAQLQGGVSTINAKSIPTNLSNAHTKLVGEELFLNSRYKVGYWHEEQVNDTTVNRTYIPVSSFIWTLKYVGGKHLFLDDATGETGRFFEHTYLDNRSTRDRTTYWTLSNTVGVSLLEGFHKYAKFGLAAYITHQLRKYNQTPDTLDRTDPALGLDPFPEGINGIDPKSNENLAWAGAQLSKQKGSLLTYMVTGELGILGSVAGDVKIDGNVSTRFKLMGDSVTITGYGRFSNTAAPYLMNNYVSNHFVWRNNFGKERRLRLGGELDISHTGSRINVGVENVQNLIYFNSQSLPVQHDSNVQVFSARLEQRFNIGIMHWDNRLTYQTSSDDNVLPLPKFAAYSNLYLLFRVATLHVQFGVDCDYYTRYYAPGYQPATASFYNQREIEVGNYPFMNVYANMKLGKARFYVMMSHINQGWFGNEYFSLPHYPLNPRRFLLGISVDFAN